jgi:hypothetical protein
MGAGRPFAKRLGCGSTGSNPVPSAASGAPEHNGSAGLIGAGHRIGIPAAACGMRVRLPPLPLDCQRADDLAEGRGAGLQSRSCGFESRGRLWIRGQRSEIRDQRSFAALAQRQEAPDSESGQCRFESCVRHSRNQEIRCSSPTGRGRGSRARVLRVRIPPAA